MANNNNTYVEWYLSRDIDIFLNDDLYLRTIVKHKKQRRDYMKGSFYHDSIEGVQKVRAYFIPEEREDISTTSVLDEVGQIVSYEGDLYVYTKNLTYQKISLAS